MVKKRIGIRNLSIEVGMLDSNGFGISLRKFKDPYCRACSENLVAKVMFNKDSPTVEEFKDAFEVLDGEFKKAFEVKAEIGSLLQKVWIPNDFNKIVEAKKEIYPLPTGDIISNPITGNRDRILLDLGDWLKLINNIRKWLGCEFKTF